MAKKRRAAGGGRKSQGEFSRLNAAVSVRMPEDIRGKLELAARESGKSLTQELLRRVSDSFDRDRQRKLRDPASRALCYLLAELIELVALNSLPDTGGSHGIAEWRADPFTFRVVKLAFAQVLDALEPRGQITRPERDWLAPYMISGDSPEEMARNAAAVTLMLLHRFEPSSLIFRGGASEPEISKKDEHRKYGMQDASRDLLMEHKS